MRNLTKFSMGLYHRDYISLTHFRDFYEGYYPFVFRLGHEPPMDYVDADSRTLINAYRLMTCESDVRKKKIIRDGILEAL